MSPPVFTISPETNSDTSAVAALTDTAFGPGRLARTAYRLREGINPVDGLSFIARANSNNDLVGSIRFWPVRINEKPVLLLGPLVIHPQHRARGIGLALMQHALNAAAQLNHQCVILVGDEPYYARAGFSRIPPATITMPDPVDPNRLLAKELVSGALNGLTGMIVKSHPSHDSRRPSHHQPASSGTNTAITASGPENNEKRDTDLTT